LEQANKVRIKPLYLKKVPHLEYIVLHTGVFAYPRGGDPKLAEPVVWLLPNELTDYKDLSIDQEGWLCGSRDE
jgi:hypothetical protein